MNRHVRHFGFALSFCAFACSTDRTKPSAPTSVDAGSDGRTSVAPKTFKLHWSLGDITATFTADGSVADAGKSANGVPVSPPVAGAKVCVHGHPEIACVTSAADGTFELLGLEALTDYVLTVDKDGFLKVSRSIQTASTDMDVTSSIFMFEAAKDASPTGPVQTTTTGAMDFFAIAPVGASDPNAIAPVAGVSVQLSPTVPASAGPFFSDGKGKFVPSATSTLDGLGFYYNLTPGDYTITYTAPKYDCVPILLGLAAWGVPAGPASVKFTALEGYLTDGIGALCTPKSVIVDTGDGG